MTNESHEYKVVLEFHGEELQHFDRVIALEMKLEEELLSGEVDGHDVGGGIVNIFIVTRVPKRCLEEAMRIINDMEPKLNAAGYRDLEEDDYERLWPMGDLTRFKLK